MQPIAKDEHGTYRFKANAIVQYLLGNGGIDLNKLAILPFDKEDRMQFAQLIGYSVSGYGDLPYASKKSVEKADEIVAEMLTAEKSKA